MPKAPRNVLKLTVMEDGQAGDFTAARPDTMACPNSFSQRIVRSLVRRFFGLVQMEVTKDGDVFGGGSDCTETEASGRNSMDGNDSRFCAVSVVFSLFSAEPSSSSENCLRTSLSLGSTKVFDLWSAKGAGPS